MAPRIQRAGLSGLSTGGRDASQTPEHQCDYPGAGEDTTTETALSITRHEAQTRE